MALLSLSLDELTIADEASFAHVGLYARLKRVVQRSGQRFLAPGPGTRLSWDRATFLNLTFWTPAASTDVLAERGIAADVVAHVAWHHLAAKQLAKAAPGAGGAVCAAGLFFAESIASAFDVYLVGRLLPNAPDSDFIATQVPIMSEAAEQAGLDEAGFAALLENIAQEPERAFEELRELLFDVASALLRCSDAPAAQQALEQFERQRFASLLHHFQLSNWVLYARAFGTALPEQERAVEELDAALRNAPVALDWLAGRWLGPTR